MAHLFHRETEPIASAARGIAAIMLQCNPFTKLTLCGLHLDPNVHSFEGIRVANEAA